jgi:hypothetical protein
MKKPDRPKTNEFGWILSFLFPKKGKALSKPGAAPVSASPPAALPHPPTATSSPVSALPPAAPPRAQPAPPVFISPPPPTPKPAAPVEATSKPVAPAEEKKPGLFSFQPGKLFPAFWTVTGALSLLVNIILIVTLIILGQELFELKRLVGGHVLGGLYDNFVKMDEAHIATNITVKDNIPVKFDLPISQDTVVVLTEPTYIANVMINLNSGGLSINSTANITLPAGTNLPVHLALTVPVDANIPITLNVPVDIPLNQTELHEPFVGLQNVIGPFNGMLVPGITTASEVPECGNAMTSWFCNTFFVK